MELRLDQEPNRWRVLMLDGQAKMISADTFFELQSFVLFTVGDKTPKIVAAVNVAMVAGIFLTKSTPNKVK